MSKLIIAGNEIIPGTITVTTNNSTITPKDDLRVILNISAVGAVTLSDGTDTTQRVEVFNVSSSACSITYKGSGGNVTYSLRNASGMTLLWTGTYWKATIAGLITGTDANGNTINYTSEATIDLHEEPVQYSTTEQDTGKTWIDGKAIYRRVVDCGAIPSGILNSQQLFAFDGIDHIHMISNWHSSDSGTATIVVPNNLSYSVSVYVKRDGVYVWTGADRSSWGHLWVLVEYTKTTD